MKPTDDDVKELEPRNARGQHLFVSDGLNQKWDKINEIIRHINKAQQHIDKVEITPEQLHEWYLEATKHLDPQYVNPKAQVSYEELKPSQKAIDKYIANKINEAKPQPKNMTVHDLAKIILEPFNTGIGLKQVTDEVWAYELAEALHKEIYGE